MEECFLTTTTKKLHMKGFGECITHFKKRAVLKLMMTCDNKHLGQGDVMFSSLCNIVADMLAILTAIAKDYGKGL
jgi:hypothetical protein